MTQREQTKGGNLVESTESFDDVPALDSEPRSSVITITPLRLTMPIHLQGNNPLNVVRK